MLKNAPVIAYFDLDVQTDICVDLRPIRVAAIMAQTGRDGCDRHVVANASRFLSDTEANGA